MRDWVPVRDEPLSGLDVTVVSPAGVSCRFDSFVPNQETEILDLEPGTWTVYNNTSFILCLGANSDTDSGYDHINYLRPSECHCFDWRYEDEAWKLTGTLRPSAQIFSRSSVDTDDHIQGAKAASKLNKWEYLFYRYMVAAGTSCCRISEGSSKTPDFTVTLSNQTIPVEFKEFSPNADEQRDEALLRTRGYGETRFSVIGRRIVKVAGRARSQLRSFFEQFGDGPGILAIFESSVLGHAGASRFSSFV